MSWTVPFLISFKQNAFTIIKDTCATFVEIRANDN